MIRTARGRWGTLSPVYPWVIETEYKKYGSLLNFVLDDTLTKPAKLLSSHKEISPDKIIKGLQYLLRTYPQFKNYLYDSPNDLKFVNPIQPKFEQDYNHYLLEAKNTIKKFRIKGKEVIEKQKKFEMLGAKIVGDEAFFEYDAKEQINKVVYGIDSELIQTRLNYVGNMIASYIYLYDKLPEFLMSHDENPAVFYAMVKNHPEQIAKILCTINVQNFEPIVDIDQLIMLINERIGSLWPYIVFPKELHPGIKKTDGINELIKMIKYQLEYNTIFKEEITVRLQMLDFSFKPSKIEILTSEIKLDGTESSEDSISIEVLDIEDSSELVLEDPQVFTDKWVIWSEDESSTTNDSENFESARATPVQKELPVVAPVVPPVVAPSVVQPVLSVQQQIQYESAQSLLKGKKIVQPVAQPLVQPAVQPLVQQSVAQPQPTPVVQPQPAIQEFPSVVQPPPVQVPQLPWDQRFSKIMQLGHVIEPLNPLSPFGKNPVFYKGEKYENMLAVLYTEAINSIIPNTGVFKNNANKARAHLQAYNKSDEVIIWFKDKGIEILKDMVNSPLYKQRKQQMSVPATQLTFLFSRRKQTSVLLEPYVGTIKTDSGGIPFFTITINGYNCAGQLQT